VHGANRVGDNLCACALLALDATTGKRLWHFQAVRHNIWDRDVVDSSFVHDEIWREFAFRIQRE
jgi:glucose dehydrogenase